jgi:hypothetical protein
VADPVLLRRLTERTRLSVLCPPGETADQVGARLDSLSRRVVALRLGPGEWLLEGPFELESEFHRQVTDCLTGLLADVQNVTDAWDGWLLEGPREAVLALLAQGGAIDPVLIDAPGSVDRRLLGPFAALLFVLPAAQAALVEIRVERSYADSLGVWLRRRLGRTAGSSGGGIISREAGA